MLTAGQRLGHFEIVGPIGKGGMGEVWRARDVQLQRNVALKVLPAGLATDPERLARFQREASLLASLNHPNIATVYGVESGALVMELVDGPMLSDRIKPSGTEQGRPIPVDEALPLIRQIVDAIEYAHDHNILHRDLKPANIKITEDGLVKVLDFGLAKALDERAAREDQDNSPTATFGATMPGSIMGTAAYMSPEQVLGKHVDRRSDIFSFGCILFEILTGARAFPGDTASETLVAVAKNEPDWSAIPTATPAYLRDLTRRCLVKDRKQRLQAIGEARLALAGALDAKAGGQPEATVTVVGARRSHWLPWGVAAALAAGLATLAWMHFTEPAPTDAPLIQTEIERPGGVTNDAYALSPDGTRLAGVGTGADGIRRVYYRPLAARGYTVVPESDGTGQEVPFWSPDSQWLGFSAQGKILKWNPSSGQPPQNIGNGSINVRGAWNEDDVILFDEQGRLKRLSAGGGDARDALSLNTERGETGQAAPFLLPGGRALLYASARKEGGLAHVFASLDGTTRRHLFDSTYGPTVYVSGQAGRWVVYANAARLLAWRFDPTTGELQGEAVPLADGVSSGANFSFSAGGLLVYRMNQASSERRLRWYGRDGRAGNAVGTPGDLSQPRLSPDGRRALAFGRTTGNDSNLLLIDLATGTSEQLFSVSRTATWTPDGTVVYAGGTPTDWQLVERAPDALASPSVLARFPGDVPLINARLSRNGRTVVVSRPAARNSEHLVVSRPGGKSRTLRIDGVGMDYEYAISPDGRWVVQQLMNPERLAMRGIPEDVDQPIPALMREIAAVDATNLVWRADGRELLYQTRQGALMSIAVDWSSGTPRTGAPRKLFDAPNVTGFDATADGQRFLVVENTGNNTSAPLVLVQNWEKLLAK